MVNFNNTLKTQEYQYLDDRYPSTFGYWYENGSSIPRMLWEKVLSTGETHDLYKIMVDILPYRLSNISEFVDDEAIRFLSLVNEESSLALSIIMTGYLSLPEILQLLPKPPQIGFNVNDMIHSARLIQTFETIRFAESVNNNLLYNSGDYRHFYILKYPGFMALLDTNGQLLSKINLFSAKITYYGKKYHEYSDLLSFIRGSLFRLADFFPRIKFFNNNTKRPVRPLDRISTYKVYNWFNFNQKNPLTEASNFSFIKIKKRLMRQQGIDPYIKKNWDNFSFTAVKVVNPYYIRWGTHDWLESKKYEKFKKGLNYNKFLENLYNPSLSYDKDYTLELLAQCFKFAKECDSFRTNAREGTQPHLYQHYLERGFWWRDAIAKGNTSKSLNKKSKDKSVKLEVTKRVVPLENYDKIPSLLKRKKNWLRSSENDDGSLKVLFNLLQGKFTSEEFFLLPQLRLFSPGFLRFILNNIEVNGILPKRIDNRFDREWVNYIRMIHQKNVPLKIEKLFSSLSKPNMWKLRQFEEVTDDLCDYFQELKLDDIIEHFPIVAEAEMLDLSWTLHKEANGGQRRRFYNDVLRKQWNNKESYEVHFDHISKTHLNTSKRKRMTAEQQVLSFFRDYKQYHKQLYKEIFVNGNKFYVPKKKNLYLNNLPFNKQLPDLNKKIIEHFSRRKSKWEKLGYVFKLPYNFLTYPNGGVKWGSRTPGSGPDILYWKTLKTAVLHDLRTKLRQRSRFYRIRKLFKSPRIIRREIYSRWRHFSLREWINRVRWSYTSTPHMYNRVFSVRNALKNLYWNDKDDNYLPRISTAYTGYSYFTVGSNDDVKSTLSELPRLEPKLWKRILMRPHTKSIAQQWYKLYNLEQHYPMLFQYFLENSSLLYQKRSLIGNININEVNRRNVFPNLNSEDYLIRLLKLYLVTDDPDEEINPYYLWVFRVVNDLYKYKSIVNDISANPSMYLNNTSRLENLANMLWPSIRIGNKHHLKKKDSLHLLQKIYLQSLKNCDDLLSIYEKIKKNRRENSPIIDGINELGHNYTKKVEEELRVPYVSINLLKSYLQKKENRFSYLTSNDVSNDTNILRLHNLKSMIAYKNHLLEKVNDWELNSDINKFYSIDVPLSEHEDSSEDENSFISYIVVKENESDLRSPDIELDEITIDNFDKEEQHIPLEPENLSNKSSVKSFPQENYEDDEDAEESVSEEENIIVSSQVDPSSPVDDEGFQRSFEPEPKAVVEDSSDELFQRSFKPQPKPVTVESLFERSFESQPKLVTAESLFVGSFESQPKPVTAESLFEHSLEPQSEPHKQLDSHSGSDDLDPDMREVERIERLRNSLRDSILNEKVPGTSSFVSLWNEYGYSCLGDELLWLAQFFNWCPNIDGSIDQVFEGILRFYDYPYYKGLLFDVSSVHSIDKAENGTEMEKRRTLFYKLFVMGKHFPIAEKWEGLPQRLTSDPSMRHCESFLSNPSEGFKPLDVICYNLDLSAEAKCLREENDICVITNNWQSVLPSMETVTADSMEQVREKLDKLYTNFAQWGSLRGLDCKMSPHSFVIYNDNYFTNLLYYKFAHYIDSDSVFFREISKMPAHLGWRTNLIRKHNIFGKAVENLVKSEFDGKYDFVQSWQIFSNIFFTRFMSGLYPRTYNKHTSNKEYSWEVHDRIAAMSYYLYKSLLEQRLGVSDAEQFIRKHHFVRGELPVITLRNNKKLRAQFENLNIKNFFNLLGQTLRYRFFARGDTLIRDPATNNPLFILEAVYSFEPWDVDSIDNFFEPNVFSKLYVDSKYISPLVNLNDILAYRIQDLRTYVQEFSVERGTLWRSFESDDKIEKYKNMAYSDFFNTPAFCRHFWKSYSELEKKIFKGLVDSHLDLGNRVERIAERAALFDFIIELDWGMRRFTFAGITGDLDDLYYANLHMHLTKLSYFKRLFHCKCNTPANYYHNLIEYFTLLDGLADQMVNWNDKRAILERLFANTTEKKKWLFTFSE